MLTSLLVITFIFSSQDEASTSKEAIFGDNVTSSFDFISKKHDILSDDNIILTIDISCDADVNFGNNITCRVLTLLPKRIIFTVFLI
jgi:hypothetical protein